MFYPVREECRADVPPTRFMPKVLIRPVSCSFHPANLLGRCYTVKSSYNCSPRLMSCSNYEKLSSQRKLSVLFSRFYLEFMTEYPTLLIAFTMLILSDVFFIALNLGFSCRRILRGNLVEFLALLVELRRLGGAVCI